MEEATKIMEEKTKIMEIAETAFKSLHEEIEKEGLEGKYTVIFFKNDVTLKDLFSKIL